MAKTKKTTVKEGLAEDTAKVKALKRKTRKVLKDPSKAGEVADDLANGGIDAPESAKDEDKASADAEPEDSSVSDVDGADIGDDVDGLDASDHPDLCTFLEKAIANSKDAIAKYEKTLSEFKDKVKEMGLDIPGLMDPEDVSDEQTPEEFPAGSDVATDGEAGTEPEATNAPEADVAPEGSADGDQGSADAGDEQEAAQTPDDASPIPTKGVESSIAAPAPTSGTKLK